MNIRIHRAYLLLFFDLLWVAFLMLSPVTALPASLFNVLALLALVVVPGALTVMALRLKGLALYEYVIVTVGVGLFELISTGLVVNTVFPYVGIVRPLDAASLVPEISIVIAVLAFISWFYSDDIEITNARLPRFSFHEIVVLIFPSFLVVLSVFGAIHLNNGASGIITFCMLIGAALYAWILIARIDEIDDSVAAFGLYFLALAFLLMTSLRGEYITGHDVQREFSVFDLTKTNGLWLISNFKDAYNACMSITVVPTILSNLLRISDPLIYKVIYQCLFAFVPGAIYFLVRRYASRSIATLSALYFIIFPTFFGDMPFLNRQEMALFFVALMFLFIFNEKLPCLLRQMLFVLFGCATVLSHYSTTYIVLAILLFVVTARPIIHFCAGYVQRLGIFKNSAVAFLSPAQEPKEKPIITWWMVTALLVASFLWSSILTDTSSNSLYRVVSQTFASLGKNMKDEDKSSDVLYSLFSWKKSDPQKLISDYEEKVVAPIRWKVEPRTFYDAKTYTQFPIRPAKAELMPLTALGKVMDSFHIDVPTFNYVFRQITAKLIQILLVVGIVYALFSRRFFLTTLPTDFVLLVGGNVILIAGIVILPMLSTEYGILRAFQQALMVSSMFVVTGSMALMSFIRRDWIEKGTLLFALVFMLSTTGILTQSLGGYEAQLHLNNAGSYYDAYYLESTDVAGTDWLAVVMRENGLHEYQSGLQTNSNLFAPHGSSAIFASHNIYPGLVARNSFVLLGRQETYRRRAPLSYKGDLVSYEYPIEFLSSNKNLVYNNGPVTIYR